MSATVLYGERVTELPGATSEGGHLWLAKDDLERATGWTLEPQGLCRGDACVQTDPAWLDGEGRVDLAAFAAHMNQPCVHEDALDVWSFGESAGTLGNALNSLEAPDFTLPDLDGREHSLSDFRGKKVFLYSWGSY